MLVYIGLPMLEVVVIMFVVLCIFRCEIDVSFFIYREWGKVYAPCCFIELLIIAPCEGGLVYIRMLLRTPSIFDAD